MIGVITMKIPNFMQVQDQLNRRTFFKGASSVMTAAAMHSLLPSHLFGNITNIKPKAKRVIYLFQKILQITKLRI